METAWRTGSRMLPRMDKVELRLRLIATLLLPHCQP
jgi:hypothetical protein